MRRDVRLIDHVVEDDYFWDVNAKANAMIEYWTLRMLVRLDGIDMYFTRDGEGTLTESRLARFLGLEEGKERGKWQTKQQMLVYLESRLVPYEKKRPKYPKILRRNLRELSRMAGLSEVEQEILALLIYVHRYGIVDMIARDLVKLRRDCREVAIGALLGYSADAVRQALDPKERLVRSGLVRDVGSHRDSSLRRNYQLPIHAFARKMIRQPNAVKGIVEELMPRCEAAKLTLGDYDHLAKMSTLARRYVSRALKQNRTGVNILLYGPPGTGKTEWAKALAAAVEVPLFGVSSQGEGDAPATAKERMQAYQFGLTFLGRSDAVILYDEVENILGSNMLQFFLFRSHISPYKPWLTRVMETNPLPTIWIVNDIRPVDPALVRRFDVVIEMPIPPLYKRREILLRHGAKILSPVIRKKIAADPNVSPAVVERVIRVVRQSRISAREIDRMAVDLIDGTLKAQGHVPLGSSVTDMLPEGYDPRRIRCDTDLAALGDRLKDRPSARICLYGPPGTGKSAYGHWLGEVTGREVLVRKGSDLISKFVGETERNIAMAFEQAQRDNVILLFDEVDSFLRARSGARYSWEVTQVNEMLSQMERFEGIFVATTNLIDDLDEASLRRFDLKLAFGYMLPDQVWEMFVLEGRRSGIAHREMKHLKEQVRELAYLTPGDFAAVRRQGRFDPIRNGRDLLTRLRREMEMKEDASRSAVGFLREV